jgi:hypothetical protein
MLNKLFGKKKESYFLEVEEEPKSPAETPEITPESALETPAVEEVSSEVVQAEPTQSTKATVKEKPASKTITTTTKVAAYEPPEWVKAIKNYSSSASTEAQKVQAKSTFATTYLMANPPTSRRRPGPSLKQFKDMASQMKSSMK